MPSINALINRMTVLFNVSLKMLRFHQILRSKESFPAYLPFTPVKPTDCFKRLVKIMAPLLLLASLLLRDMQDQINNSIGRGNSMSEYRYPIGLDADANFVGWQETLSGKSFPLFNITAAAHPLYGSTVSDVTLRGLGLRVPQTRSSYDVTDLTSNLKK